MTTVIVGAGPGLGRSLARRFGAEGHTVALVGRTRATLDTLVAELGAEGIRGQGFVADVTDRAALVAAFDAIKAAFGPVDVLEYSPAPSDPAAIGAVGAVDLTVESLLPQLDVHLFGAVTAVRQVLPDMIARDSGTILVSTGASSGPVVHPPFANIAAASGALRNWTLNLHAALADTGVHVGHVAIALWIGEEGPASEPDALAERYWQQHRERTAAEIVLTAGAA
ncbi:MULTISPECIES: SDR family NAD(P)-dependent oxidoreductase [Streptomyces]|uniref:SDR family NAD(P)-dependent oxidoreductase n=1 Tax=Streptomyces evansiae TaxID=3075535 RepID=A0ABU2R8J5_9ACTN|nr:MULTISPECIES: SDR family NAD(P)-dependent oxidoreductase [unclassified Streptomyces]EFK98318.1 oxidoreductase [Streptomyces sp. SPB78]MDT0413023.1 SDR family NAD(P)-dependent oxidoreductase [Streptomyces sp. DSM 41979]SCE50227.1 short chain dehydrogenase [Streptomyces sp. DfronAA-171]